MHWLVSVSQITIFSLYLLSALAFAMQRLPSRSAGGGRLLTAALLFLLAALYLHGQLLHGQVFVAAGLNLSISNIVSLIGWQLALIALLGAVEANLRGMSSGLLAIAAIASAATAANSMTSAASSLSWQIEAHVLVSVFAYALLTAGAIVALFAMLQDRRLRAGKLSAGNQLFAPLETTERMLFGVTAAGFGALLLAVVSGFAFVDDLFAQHLVHKTALSLLALVLFGTLLAGRLFAGWRGGRAVTLYLWGFIILGLAYFGSRLILEQVLNRSWG